MITLEIMTEKGRETAVTILLLTGRLDSRNAPDLETRLVDLAAAATPAIVLDLAGVDYISSAGLRLLLLTARRVSNVGGRMVLCAPQEQVLDVLRISGLARAFRIHAGREAAMADLAAAEGARGTI